MKFTFSCSFVAIGYVLVVHLIKKFKLFLQATISWTTFLKKSINVPKVIWSLGTHWFNNIYFLSLSFSLPPYLLSLSLSLSLSPLLIRIGMLIPTFLSLSLSLFLYLFHFTTSNNLYRSNMLENGIFLLGWLLVRFTIFFISKHSKDLKHLISNCL